MNTIDAPTEFLKPLYPRLLGDVGGTNVRLAWQERPGQPLMNIVNYQCAGYTSLEEAIRHYLSVHSLPSPEGCAIGIANPVTGDQVRMTNNPWTFSIAQLRLALGCEDLVVINDFTALALALPRLQPEDLVQIGPGRPQPDAAKGVLGPGTGLGVSGLVPGPSGQWVPIAGEGGHVTLAATSEGEAAVIQWIARRAGHVSAERALSGQGLVNLYEACCALSGKRPSTKQPAEVLAEAETDRCCGEAVDLFCSLLGSMAGNLALTLGARGGIYIGGGIAPRLIDRIRASTFRAKFVEKGRFSDYLESIPTWIIRASVSPALMGVGVALDLHRRGLG